MRDVDHPELAFPKCSYDTKYFLRLGLGERRGRLIEDQQARALLNATANLDHLFAGRAELFHLPFRLQGEVVLLDNPDSALVQFPAIHPAHRQPGFTAQEDVLGDGKVRREQRLLMHHRDTLRRRLGRAAEIHSLAMPRQLSAVALKHSGHDLHQR